MKNLRLHIVSIRRYFIKILISRTPQKRTKKRRDYDSEDDEKIEETEGKCPYKYMIDRQTNRQQKTVCLTDEHIYRQTDKWLDRY